MRQQPQRPPVKGAAARRRLRDCAGDGKIKYNGGRIRKRFSRNLTNSPTCYAFRETLPHNPSVTLRVTAPFTGGRFWCGIHRFTVVGVHFTVYGFPHTHRSARGAAGMGLGRGGFSTAPSQGAFFAYFLGKYESEPPEA